jgi:hypothetical protein
VKKKTYAELKSIQKEREFWRRFPIKLSTAALISVIGPASAWNVGGYNGLLIYIGVYILSKLLSAQFASLSPSKAISTYRYSPLLLVAGGVIPFASELLRLHQNQYVFVLLVPFLLGSYEGAYWTGYHDIRRVFKSKDENENHSVMKFTRIEVFCTAIGALVAARLKLIESDSMFSDPGVIAGLIAFSAFAIPWNKQIFDTEQVNFGKDSDKDSITKGKLISQPFAVMQFVATNGMRFAALQKSVMWLGILVAIAEAAGHIVSEIYEAWPNIKQNSAKKLVLWNSGNYITLCGFIGMIFGVYVDNFWYFIAGWFFAQGALRGILRRVEIQFADSALTSETNSTLDIELQIGLRERLKFKAHTVIVLLLIIPSCYLNSDNLVLLLLTIGVMSCFLSLRLPKKEPEYFKVPKS